MNMTDKNSALSNEIQPPPKTQSPPQEGSAYTSHDAFFKDILANIAHAKAVMRYILDADIVAALDWDKMEPQKDTFIIPAGRELRADALFKLPFKDAGKHDYVYLLLEHKSTQPSGINSQLKSYVDHIANQLHGAQNIPHLVIPIVFYHGRARWKWPSRLPDAFPLPKKYRKVFIWFIPQTEELYYLLFDALASELAELPSPLPQELSLALVGHIYHHVFQKIWQSSDELGKNFSFLANLFTIDKDMAEKIVYYLSNYHKMSRAVILERLNPKGKEETMLTYTEMKEGLIQEGVQKGIREERQELAQNMLTEGLSIETIVRITGLSEEDVRGLN